MQACSWCWSWWLFVVYISLAILCIHMYSTVLNLVDNENSKVKSTLCLVWKLLSYIGVESTAHCQRFCFNSRLSVFQPGKKNRTFSTNMPPFRVTGNPRVQFLPHNPMPWLASFIMHVLDRTACCPHLKCYWRCMTHKMRIRQHWYMFCVLSFV